MHLTSLRCAVAPLRETFFLLSSQRGLEVPLIKYFLTHATAQRRNVQSQALVFASNQSHI
jgi:hypothetical protein